MESINRIRGLRLLLGYLGYFMMMIGIIVLLPLVVILVEPTEIVDAYQWLFPGIASIFIGFLLSSLLKGKVPDKLDRHQDAVLITWFWLIAILISAMPFWISGHYTFTESIFESTSGYSTTGLSVVDVSTASKTMLLYRSLMQFFGGVGLILVLTSAISDRYGMRLYYAEGHNDKLLPNLARSARLILSFYITYIVLGSVAYVIFGMTPFDAINHAIASLSTGGFSTRPESIGYYQSLPIEIITIVLMILGSTNLIIHLMLVRGRIKQAFKHIESRLFIVITLLFMPILFFSITSTFGDLSFRVALFQYVSAITTTGFQTVPQFQGLPYIFNFGVIILMIVGGQAGSTSGGIKQYRIGLWIKQMYWNLQDKLSHMRTIRTRDIQRFGKRVIIHAEDLDHNNTFIALYMIILIVGTAIFMSFGYTMEASLFEFSSSLGTVGLSIGIIKQGLNPILLWTSILGMLFGRLEFYVIIYAFARGLSLFNKKKVLI